MLSRLHFIKTDFGQIICSNSSSWSKTWDQRWSENGRGGKDVTSATGHSSGKREHRWTQEEGDRCVQEKGSSKVAGGEKNLKHQAGEGGAKYVKWECSKLGTWVSNNSWWEWWTLATKSKGAVLVEECDKQRRTLKRAIKEAEEVSREKWTGDNCWRWHRSWKVCVNHTKTGARNTQTR